MVKLNLSTNEEILVYYRICFFTFDALFARDLRKAVIIVFMMLSRHRLGSIQLRDQLKDFLLVQDKFEVHSVLSWAQKVEQNEPF